MDSKRIIVALDFPDAEAALACAGRLDPERCRVKVGKELFVASGPGVIARLRERGFEVFLDLKFHDIPSTVAGACRAAARHGAWMVNVHASGGEAMMRAAREAVAGEGTAPLVTAVTVLTSLADADLARVGFAFTAREAVARLARLARDCGLDGVVCSAQEAAIVREAAGAGFLTVTPGIRLPGEAAADQARVATPAEAARLGAHYLVVGRPVTRAPDPVAALEAIRRSLETEGHAA